MASVYPRTVEHAGPGSAGAGARRRRHRALRRPIELVQFAVMGSAYARVISKVAAPRVALLNMGHERGRAARC